MKLGLFRRIPFDSNPDEYQDQIDELAFEAEAFLRWIGIDVEVDGYVFEGDNNTAPLTPPSYGKDGFAMKAIKAYKKEYDVECEYHLAVGGGHNSRCGQAISAPSSWGVVYTNMPSYACNTLHTTCHEFVHMLGRYHSGYYDSAKAEYKPYGDGACLMGLNNLVMPNAGHMCELGLVKYKLVNTSQIIKLMPLELNEWDMLPEHYRAARIGDYYLSIRKGVGIPFPIKIPAALYIHEINSRIMGELPPEQEKKKKKYTYRHKPNLTPDDSRFLPTGTLIEYLDYDEVNEIAIVKITLGVTA